MSKRKSRNGAMIVALVLLLVFTVGLLFSLTNGFSSDVKTFALKRSGAGLILNDSKGLKLRNEEQFEIINLKNENRDFSVRVYAYGEEESDFEFAYGAEKGYSWKNFTEEERRDFSDCFNITLEKNLLTIKHEGLRWIVGQYNSEILLPESYPKGDKFVLEISCDDEKISLSFDLYTQVMGVNLDREEIAFGE